MSGSIKEGFVSALMVGDYEDDRLLMHDIFRRLGWRLFEAQDRRKGLEYLESHPVQVVLAESHAPRWHWKRVLGDLRRLTHPPQLIVTSRAADESLWAEVLNVGGYDVLARPLEKDEVERVVAAARRRYDWPERERGAWISTLGAA